MSSPPEDFLPLTHLSFEILMVLAAAPLHGYAAIQELHRSPACVSKPRTGTFYSAIRRLLEDRLVEETDAPEEEQDSRRRYYRLTAEGQAVLAAETKRLEALVRAARGTLAARGKGGQAWEASS